jgi:cell wall-associated NlpC family hydrolase
MHLTSNVARRLRRAPEPGAPGDPRRSRRLVPVLVSLLMVIGTAVGAVLATAGGKPAAPTSSSLVPSARPASGSSAAPVVPLLSGRTDANGAVPVVTGIPVTFPRPAATPKVAPLHGLRQADLLVVAPFTLSSQVRGAVSRQPGVTSAEPLEAAKVTINGSPQAVLGVDPSTFRAYAAGPTAASNPLWQGVAGGGVAVSYTMGTLDKLSLGGGLTVTGRQPEHLRVVAFGTVGIGGVDAVVSDAVARSLGMPAANAIVVSAPPASLPALVNDIKRVLPRGASVEPLVSVTAQPSAAGLPAGSVSTTAGLPAGSVSTAGGAMTAAELTTALRAAESRQGLPYVWGAAGPSSFDCSGLVQWSFAQAGVRMPRVAADQARTGPAVPASQLQPGDLLFYHTDPTAPGYISHVAIYLGNGWMIQAPQPGMNVQIVPANFGSQFAGAIRVYPQLASDVAAGLA